MLRRTALQLRQGGTQHGFSRELTRTSGQVAGMGRKDTRGSGGVTTLGCVLNRTVSNFALSMKDPLAWVPALKNNLKARYVLSDLRRRRDDLEPAVASQVYKALLVAVRRGEISTLSRILSPYEFPYYQQLAKKAMTKNRTARGMSQTPPTVDVELGKAYFANADAVDFKDTEYVQFSLRVSAKVTTTREGQEAEVEVLDEYVTFELAQSQDSSIVNPVRICGLYTLRGERIGEDGVDPSRYKEQLESA